MQVRALGHVVLNVRDRARSEAFYSGVLGIPIASRSKRFQMTFFTLGNHHDFAVVEIGADAPAAKQPALGLRHLAFNIGTTRDELREAKRRLEGAGLVPLAIDHGITESLYVDDPDGNRVELYVDVSDAWKREPMAMVARADPLEL
jgi:catechol 2,3-dioxygenase